ncbi:MAG: hypothetical protein P1P84_25060, partial [Deferrisomatales bacterium]|nr:hypothetical protein [Deferrisomatales bacterium]
ESHLFLPVETDEATNRITAVTATVCGTASCHPGLAGSEVQIWKHEYEGALGALQAALEARGIFFLPSYPYFFNDHNGDGVVPTPGYTFDHDGDAETDPIAEDNRSNGFTNWAGPYGVDNWRNTMGAAFNYNLLEHDPGGYAHNDFYIKGLIWDSIDFIYNGVLDNDVPAALNNLGLDAATRAAALDYLDSARPGDANRPPLP